VYVVEPVDNDPNVCINLMCMYVCVCVSMYALYVCITYLDIYIQNIIREALQFHKTGQFIAMLHSEIH